MQVHVSAHGLLRVKGLRATPGRISLLELLQKREAPVTAEEISAELKDLDLVTIYRNLQSLVTVGIVSEVRFKDASVRYEYVHGQKHHHHLVCSTCGTVDELPECDVRDLETQALKKSGRFASVEEHALEFFGTCRSCAR